MLEFPTQLSKKELIWVVECGTFKINSKLDFMSVDVEIYMNNMVKFFKENPSDLLNLIPKNKEEEFYLKIREESFKNIEKGEDASLTQKQLMDICVILNGKDPVKDRKVDGVFLTTPFGLICLN
jgi:hypothetical protein